MKTNTKSSRPLKRYAIHLMGHPYGLVTAKTTKQAISFFHSLTKNRYKDVFGYDVEVAVIK